jgi:hypothetical protein
MCFRSNESCKSRTTSFPIAFRAEKPLVQVRILPESSAVCSTGNENVKPSEIGAASPASASGKSYPESVRKASTESAR